MADALTQQVSPFTSREAAISRREAMVKALLGQGGAQVPLSSYGPLNAIADVVKAGVGAKVSADAENDRTQLSADYATARTTGMQKVVDALARKDSAALLEPAQSPINEVQQAAMTAQMELAKPHNAQPAEMGVAGQPDMRQQNERQDDGSWKPVGSPWKVGGNGAGGGQMLDNKTRYDAFHQANLWHQNKDTRDLAMMGSQRQRNLDQALALVKAGVNKGSLAGAQNALAQFTVSMGGQLDPNTANMEQIKAVLGPLILERARKLAPVTELDLKTIEQMVGADPSKMSDPALFQLLNEFKNSTASFANEYNRVGKHLANIVAHKGTDDDFGELYTFSSGGMPGTEAPTAANPGVPTTVQQTPGVAPAAGGAKVVKWGRDAQGNPVPVQ